MSLHQPGDVVRMMDRGIAVQPGLRTLFELHYSEVASERAQLLFRWPHNNVVLSCLITVWLCAHLANEIGIVKRCGWVSFGKILVNFYMHLWTWITYRQKVNFLGNIFVADVVGSQSHRIWREKAQTAITPLKVIQGHRFWYQSKACMQLPVND